MQTPEFISKWLVCCISHVQVVIQWLYPRPEGRNASTALVADTMTVYRSLRLQQACLVVPTLLLAEVVPYSAE
jgi:hypothetical protein